MIDREEALSLIAEAYAAGARGDAGAVARYCAEGARFRIAGDERLLQGLPARSGYVVDVVCALMGHFTVTDLQRIDAIVEDNKVVIRWAAKVSFDAGPGVRAEMMDLIHLDDDGRIQSVIHFTDTAQIRSMIEG